MDPVFIIVFALLVAALVMAFVRLGWGPSLPDRVIALDLTGMIIAGIVAATAVRLPVLLDIVIVLAIVSFLGTVAFARYLERRRSDD